MIGYPDGVMRALIAAILLFLTTQTAAVAESFQDKDGAWYTIIEPPARWSVAIGQKPDVRYVPRSTAFEICERQSGKAGMFGCAYLWSAGCDVTIVEDLPKRLRDAVLKHELAHCGGWPADHPTESAAYTTGWPIVTPR